MKDGLNKGQEWEVILKQEEDGLVMDLPRLGNDCDAGVGVNFPV